MERGEHFTKRDMVKSIKERVQEFVERGFDWIVLLVITLIILFSLVFF